MDIVRRKAGLVSPFELVLGGCSVDDGFAEMFSR